MKTELILAQQKIRFDREATVALYRGIKTAGADECSCISCKNFAAQRRTIYPEEFLRLLGDLGADPLKEWEAFDYDFDNKAPSHLYGGWFVFAGELIEGAKFRPGDRPFAYWFTMSFPASNKSSNAHLCAVEFLVEVPWIVPSS